MRGNVIMSEVFEFVVERQPVIPAGVLDIEVEQPYADSSVQHNRRIFTIRSCGDGVEHWKMQRLGWGMPAEMVEESKPDSIEYYRELCPLNFVAEGNSCELVRRDDGVWVWRVNAPIEPAI